MDVGVPELLIIFFVVLLMFGSTRVPKLAHSLGEAVREFRGALSTDTETAAGTNAETGTGTATVAGAATAPPVPDRPDAQDTNSGRNS